MVRSARGSPQVGVKCAARPGRVPACWLQLSPHHPVVALSPAPPTRGLLTGRALPEGPTRQAGRAGAFVFKPPNGRRLWAVKRTGRGQWAASCQD